MSSGNHSVMDVLGAVGSAMLHETDIHALVDRVLELLSGGLGLVHGAMCLCADDSLSLFARLGDGCGVVGSGPWHMGEGIVGQVALAGCSVAVPDVGSDDRFPSDVHGVSFLCVPLFRQGHVVGTLSAERQGTVSRSLSDDTHVLSVIGGWLCDAMEAYASAQASRDFQACENRLLRDSLSSCSSSSGLIGTSDAMGHIRSQILSWSEGDFPVLIVGHSGSGKKLAGRLLGASGRRSEGPFIVYRCSGLSASQVEREFFGSVSSASSSGVQGVLDSASGGTLFLDEIGCFPLSLQPRLLSFLRTGCLGRQGGGSIRSSVRIVAGTRQDLSSLCSEGSFCCELYEALSSHVMVMPDLKDRRSDIMLLSEYFLDRFNVKYNKQIRRLSTPSINLLVSYHWPGNVRELSDCLEHGVLTALGDTIHGYNLPASLQLGDSDEASSGTDSGADFHTKVASYERELLVAALKQSNGKMSAAACALGISPRVMHYKVRLHGIVPEWYRKNS